MIDLRLHDPGDLAMPFRAAPDLAFRPQRVFAQFMHSRMIAAAHRANIVALSFSVAFPKRQIPGLLQQLRTVLPAEVALWAGGGGVKRLPEVAGVELLVSLERSLVALETWRRQRM